MFNDLLTDSWQTTLTVNIIRATEAGVSLQVCFLLSGQLLIKNWYLQLLTVTESKSILMPKQRSLNLGNTNVEQFRQHTERGTQRGREQEWAACRRMLSWSPGTLSRWCSGVSPGHTVVSSAQSTEVAAGQIYCSQSVLSSQCLPECRFCFLSNTSSVSCILPVGQTH